MALFTDPVLDNKVSSWIERDKDPKFLHPNNIDEIVKSLQAWVLRAKKYRTKICEEMTREIGVMERWMELLGTPKTAHYSAQNKALLAEEDEIASNFEVSIVNPSLTSLLTKFVQKLEDEAGSEMLRAYYLLQSLKLVVGFVWKDVGPTHRAFPYVCSFLDTVDPAFDGPAAMAYFTDSTVDDALTTTRMEMYAKGQEINEEAARKATVSEEPKSKAWKKNQARKRAKARAKEAEEIGEKIGIDGKSADQVIRLCADGEVKFIMRLYK